MGLCRAADTEGEKRGLSYKQFDGKLLRTEPDVTTSNPNGHAAFHHERPCNHADAYPGAQTAVTDSMREMGRQAGCRCHRYVGRLG